MEDLTSFHFRLEHRTGATPLGAGFVIDEAEGEVVKPDKISARFTGSFGGFAIKSGLINLGDSSYMTNPLTGKWERVPPEVSPLGFFNPSRGIGAIMSQVVQPSLLSAKGDAYRLKGRLPAEALASLLGTTVKGSTVAVEFTLEADGLYLLQAIIDGRVTPTEEDGVVRVITLSRFDEPVDIKAPIP